MRGKQPGQSQESSTAMIEHELVFFFSTFLVELWFLEASPREQSLSWYSYSAFSSVHRSENS